MEKAENRQPSFFYWRSQRAVDEVQKRLAECQNLILYDLETTGTNPLYHRIIKIGAIWLRKKDGKFVEEDRLHRYIRLPECLEFPEEIEKLTGISREQLDKEPYEEECLEDILFFFEDLPVSGYNNMRFDDLFLKQCFYRHGIEWCCQDSFDILLMARDFVPSESVENFKLETIADYFGIEAEHYHSAFSDAEVTAKLLNCMMTCYQEGKRADYHGNLRPDIERIAYWGKEGQENETDKPVKRIYIALKENQTKIFYDVINGVWYTESRDIDMEWLEERCWEILGVSTEKEFQAFRATKKV
mgnify:FL=1